jgi:hypothetical protein
LMQQLRPSSLKNSRALLEENNCLKTRFLDFNVVDQCDSFVSDMSG